MHGRHPSASVVVVAVGEIPGVVAAGVARAKTPADKPAGRRPQVIDDAAVLLLERIERSARAIGTPKLSVTAHAAVVVALPAAPRQTVLARIGIKCARRAQVDRGHKPGRAMVVTRRVIPGGVAAGM